MELQLDTLAGMLGEGEVTTTESGERLFKMHSYEGNPVISPLDIGLTWQEDNITQSGAVFNGGVGLHDGRVVILPRCHKNYKKMVSVNEKSGRLEHWMDDYVSEIWPLTSENGVDFKRLGDVVIRGDGTEHKDFLYGIEDIRVFNHEGTFILVGTGKLKPPFKGEDADRIAIYTTGDFEKITYHGMVDSYDNRNAVPFFVNDAVYILLRFQPDIHITLLEGGISQLLDPQGYREQWAELEHRKEESILIGAGEHPHEIEKVGAAIPPIKTEKGWLLIYHAVGAVNRDICKSYGLDMELDRAYTVCAALLDAENPSKVLYRTVNPIYIPSKPYELEGDEQYQVDVPKVVFPVGGLVRKGKLLLYCGAGDKYIVLLSCGVDRLVEFLAGTAQ